MANASVSACGRPPRCVQPRPTTWPFTSTMTQPTAGLGQTRPRLRAASDSAAPICSRSALLRSVFVTAELADEGLEVLGLAEIAVDRGEADIGDLVQGGERIHHRFADMGGRDLGLARAFEAPDDAVHHALQTVPVHGTLAQRDLHGAQQLLAVERLARAVALHHVQLPQLHAFEGCEARTTVGALPPPANGGIVVRRSRVFDLSILVSAKRTAHSHPPKPRSQLP